jgi:hypothetical protein
MKRYKSISPGSILPTNYKLSLWARDQPITFRTSLSTNNFVQLLYFCKMAQQRLALWNAEEDLEEEVDLLTIGNYGQNMQYEDGEFFFSLRRLSWLMNNFSTHSSTSDRRVDFHSNAASYGPTSCLLPDSG